jgi:hypothetical protein
VLGTREYGRLRKYVGPRVQVVVPWTPSAFRNVPEAVLQVLSKVRFSVNDTHSEPPFQVPIREKLAPLPKITVNEWDALQYGNKTVPLRFG